VERGVTVLPRRTGVARGHGAGRGRVTLIIIFSGSHLLSSYTVLDEAAKRGQEPRYTAT